MTLYQKSLLGVTILTTVGIITLLASNRYGPEIHKRDEALLEMLSNISSELDRLDSGYDGITTQTNLAKNRLAQLIGLHRENLLLCAILGEKRDRRTGRWENNGEEPLHYGDGDGFH